MFGMPKMVKIKGIFFLYLQILPWILFDFFYYIGVSA